MLDLDGHSTCRRADNSLQFLLPMTALDTSRYGEIRRPLAGNAWFGSLPEALRCKIVDHGTMHSFGKRAVISTQGSLPRAMCAVL